MATYTINQNVNTAITDFGMIKQAIVNKGVAVPVGTPTSQYAAKIASIPSGGGSNTDFINLIEKTPNVTINIPSGTTTISDIFYSWYELGGITMPNTVTTIEDSAFEDCEDMSLTSLSNSLTTIGEGAFKRCRNIALTDLPNTITSIGYGAFDGCSSLAISRLPNGLVELRGETFSGCTSLTTMTIPSNLETLGASDFGSCTGLTTVTFEGTPTSISPYAFSGCTNLTTINVPWSSGDVSDAPWGATNATIVYDYVPTP
jgi:hypothetical protein